MTQPIWRARYPKGVPTHINPDTYRSIPDFLLEGFQQFKELPAVENMGTTYSYGKLESLSNDFASFIQHETTLKKGDRIAIQMPNLIQYPVVLFAALQCGLVVVNTNPLYTPSEMKHQFKDAGVKAIVILENFAYQLEQIVHETSIQYIITTRIGDLLGGLKGKVVNFAVKRIKKMVPPFHLPTAIPFQQALKSGHRHTFRQVKMHREDLAFLQYTGGTTGISKGAMLTHRNLMANLEQVGAWMKACLVEGEEVVITALPLYHIFALTCNLFTMFKLGAHNILITNPKDMNGFIKTLRKRPFSLITGVNTLFNGLLNHPEFASIDFSRLKLSVGGGMAVQKVVAEKWKVVTGCSIVEGYGLSEASPVLTINPLDDTNRIGTIGLPIPSTEIKIMKDETHEALPGETGELYAKGPQVMKSYWQRPEETFEVFSDKWLKTGDMATMDTDGFLKIVDRKKEMILVSGFNVYPSEVEEVISSHEKVLEVGVIGVSHPKSTEAVKALIVKKDQSLTKEEVLAHAQKTLTKYKCPKYIEFVSELPKSNVGKILRRVLKEQEAMPH